MSEIDLTKKPPQPTLTRYSNDKSAFTTGAYIQPVSYILQNGNRIFGWMVTGFEEDTYRDGAYLDVEACADSLAGLTPDEEENSKEKIYRLLIDYDSRHIELDTPFKSSLGNITSVGLNGFDIKNGEDMGEYENLNDKELDSLANEVEQQILANEKAFQKSQG
jgi:hypothetical protein